MTSPSDIPNMNSEHLKAKAEEILTGAPPEIQQAVEKSRSFIQENRPVLVTAAACYVAYRINKRMVCKVVAKALQNTSVRVDLPAYFNDLQVWEAAKAAEKVAAGYR